MYQTHEGMSKLYEVSCEELDYLNDIARECGVTGSRIMGYGRDYARTKRRQHHLGAGVVCEGIECDVSFDRGVFLACYFHCRFIRRCDVLRRK